MTVIAAISKVGPIICGLAVILANSSFAVKSPRTDDVVAFERRPYEMRLLMVFDPKSADETLRRTTVHEIQQAADRCAGNLWSLSITEISWLSPGNKRGLERVDRSMLVQQHPDVTADIWFVATVESLAVGKRVSVRSWQFEVQSRTEIVSVDVMDDRDLPITLLRLCRALVRPMGIVEQVEEKGVRIRLRGGELDPPDPSFAQLQPGDLLIPLLAYRNRDREIEKLQVIPWTYISVKEVDGSTIRGNVESGLKLALGGKKRGRIDTLVVAVRPQFAATRIQLVTQSRPSLPLAAHRVEVRSEPIIPRVTPENPEIDPASTLLADKLTDRRGFTEIAIIPGHPLVWLFAYSGQHLLARVPFVPGITAETRLEVPDDSTRLAAEADLQMLQGEVIDAVALRNTAMGTIRAAANRNDWTTVNQKLALLKQQQSSTKLIERLVAVRVAGVAAAQANKDKTAQARINRMCDEAVALIKVHLADEKVRLLSEEMEALQAPEKEPAETQ